MSAARLVYLAHPIDQAHPTVDLAVQRIVSRARAHLADNGQPTHLYTPGRAWRCHPEHPDPRVESVNRAALEQADLLVAWLPIGVPTVGVPMEIQAAVDRRIPVVIVSREGSFALAGLPGGLVWAVRLDPGTDGNPTLASELATAMELAFRAHPHRPFHHATQTLMARVWGVVENAAFPMRTPSGPDPDPLRLSAGHHTIRGEIAHRDGRWGPAKVTIDSSPPELKMVIRAGAELPTRAYDDDAGIDLTCCVDCDCANPGEHANRGGTPHWVTIQPGRFVDIPTQVDAVQLPPTVWAMITGRSSTLRRRGLHIPVAVIDPGWRGPLYIGVWNLSSQPVQVNDGDRLGQLILHPNQTAAVEIVAVTEVDPHPRGQNGFGSTGGHRCPHVPEATVHPIGEEGTTVDELTAAERAVAERFRHWFGSAHIRARDVEYARGVLVTVAPIIRADERAKVRAELLAIAAEYDREDDDSWPSHAVVRRVADRIAPAGVTP